MGKVGLMTEPRCVRLSVLSRLDWFLELRAPL